MKKPRKQLTEKQKAEAVERVKRWRISNPEKYAALMVKSRNQRRDNDPDCFARANKKYRDSHPGLHLAYYEKNKERMKLHNAKWRKSNPEAVRNLDRQNRDRHKSRIRSRKENDRLQIADYYLAQCKLMTVAQLRQYPRPVVEMWRALLLLTRSCQILQKTKNKLK